MSENEVWGTAREKIVDTFFREPIPNCRVVRYNGVVRDKGMPYGIANPILFEMADFETLEKFKSVDPEPEKLQELHVEKIMTASGKEYAIPGVHYIIRNEFREDINLIDRKRFKRIYSVLVSEECARVCAENNKNIKRKP